MNTVEKEKGVRGVVSVDGQESELDRAPEQRAGGFQGAGHVVVRGNAHLHEEQIVQRP